MTKKLLAGLGAVALMLPVAAAAATVPSFYDAIFDGQTEVWGNPREGIDAQLPIQSEGSEWIYAVSSDFIGDGVSKQCFENFPIFGGLDGQERTVSVDPNLPVNTGDYGFRVDAYTADTETEARTLRSDLNCNVESDSDTVYNESDVVHVIPSSSNDTGSSSDDDEDTIPAWFKKWWENTFDGGNTTPVNQNAAKCATVSPFLGAPKQTYSSTGVQLQSALLLDNPNSIPALAAGSTIPMGYRGPQTTAALQTFSNVYGCGFTNIAL